MPDILRIVPEGGDYRAFEKDLVSGNSYIIGRTYLVEDVYAVAFNSSNAEALRTLGAGGSILGTVVDEVGESIVWIYHAERIMLYKKQATGEGFVPGDDVFIDPSDRLVSPTRSSGFLWVGICTLAAGDMVERVEVDFNGAVTANGVV